MKNRTRFSKADRLALVTLIVALLALLFAGTQPVAESAPAPARFDGSFLQLTEAHRAWKAEDWTALVEEMKSLGLDFLIVQWTAYDGLNFAGGGSGGKAPADPPLEGLLRAADRAGLGLYVGLLQDSSFWASITLDPASVEVYLQRLRLRETELAEQLAPRLRVHRSVRGWFITEEIDDVDWRGTVRQAPLFRHLGLLAGQLDRLLPGRPVLLSGFSNGVMDPAAYAGFWAALLKAAPAIDTVLFQDGVGVGKLRPPEVPPYLKALGESTGRAGKGLWAVVEIFRETHAGSGAGAPARFTAEPAPLDRIDRQLELARPYSARLVAFSIPEYMSRRAGPAAERLRQAYQGRQRFATTSPPDPGARP